MLKAVPVEIVGCFAIALKVVAEEGDPTAGVA